MSTTLAEKSETQIARPRHVLVPLIKKDWADLKEAEEAAGQPYWLAIGQKLLEGKVTRGGFEEWVKRNFDFSVKHAERYMAVAAATNNKQIRPIGPAESLDSALRAIGKNRPSSGRVHREWQPEVDAIAERATNIRNIHEEALKREKERETQRKLGLQLIEIGYKVLASQLHPDKGGSDEAMIRLNNVRDRLKLHA
jgi:hypothetical protein